MHDYEAMGHMTKLNDTSNCQYFIPHHEVINVRQPNKIRVVFDGSMKPMVGPSLNDVQEVGPKLQNNLFDIILRFRTHRFVIAADIQHMYRQILVHEEDRPFQTILWREDKDRELHYYRLNTVTYGTTSAPYLAIKCLLQLANDHQHEYPTISDVIRTDFYVDDVLTGCETEDELRRICTDLQFVMKLGCFELHKWASNSTDILHHVVNASASPVSQQNWVRTLGIHWNPSLDVFRNSVDVFPDQILTKRLMLAEIARVFDPLGIVSPLIIKAKMLLQELWNCQLTWDEVVPTAIVKKYDKFRADLQRLDEISVPRYVFTVNAERVELHGFSDASAKAYGACVYVRSVHNDVVYTKLLCAKSRVAPIKPLTIPRLELCGALEVAKLMQTVVRAINFTGNLYLWCDSQVVLCWLKMDSSVLNVFVANRVQKIHELTQQACWTYIPTAQNPADLLSRGTTLQQLQRCHLWWDGPNFLSTNDTSEYNHDYDPNLTEIPEVRANVLAATTLGEVLPLTAFSKFGKLIRVVVYIRRFIDRWRRSNPSHNDITAAEYHAATITVYRVAQRADFAQEIHDLQHNKPLHVKSRLLMLAPFLDDHGILRVGGRLNQSQRPYDQKHPILLHGKNPVSKLVLREQHLKLLHAGIQQIIFSTRERVWITSVRTVARQVVHECVVCRRFSVKPATTIMGNLPANRLQQALPFLSTGVDFGGPYLIKDKRGRGCKEVKVYICLFICMHTKLIHLEAVTTLTSDGFIACLRRFIARRGHPQELVSDNGRTFVGAHRKLDELATFLMEQGPTITSEVSPMGIRWKFIPPYSPNFGGLWEAGIKSTKTHLKKILTSTSLIYEEFVTVLVQIEAVLNSRPLYPASNDPNDLSVLTPAHFAIGRPTTSLVDEYHLGDISVPTRYQYVQQLQRHFWDRWQRDYLCHLQVRPKWRTAASTLLKEDTMVLLRDDNLPPSKWRIGRITTVHPGADGITRVVSIRTTAGEVKRAISKISPLLHCN